MMAAFRDIRSEFYPNPLAAPQFANEAIRPIPDTFPHDARKAQLGEELYHDTRLSADGTVSQEWIISVIPRVSMGNSAV